MAPSESRFAHEPPVPIHVTFDDLDVLLKLHALYLAMYRVHGPDELKWLTHAPTPVIDAYQAAAEALEALGRDLEQGA